MKEGCNIRAIVEAAAPAHLTTAAALVAAMPSVVDPRQAQFTSNMIGATAGVTSMAIVAGDLGVVRVAGAVAVGVAGAGDVSCDGSRCLNYRDVLRGREVTIPMLRCKRGEVDGLTGG